jgi:hypothetical protein
VQAVSWSNEGNDSCKDTQYGLQNPGGVGTYYAGVIAEAQTDLSNLTYPRTTMQNVIILLSDGDANSASTNFVYGSTSLAKNECQQAVTAATNAAAYNNKAGPTWVYSVAFGASTSSSDSCSTDSGAYSGCSTMQAIASDPTKFYSDDANGCVSTAHPNIKDLGSIFQTIAYDLLSTRLLPTNTQ